MPTEPLPPGTFATLVAFLHVGLALGFLQTLQRPRPAGAGLYALALVLQVAALVLLTRIFAQTAPLESLLVAPAHLIGSISLGLAAVGVAMLLGRPLPWRSLILIGAFTLALQSLLWAYDPDGFLGLTLRPLVLASLYALLAVIAWHDDRATGPFWVRLPALSFAVLAANELVRSVRWLALGSLEAGTGDVLLHVSFGIAVMATTPLMTFALLVFVSRQLIDRNRTTERELNEAKLELATRRHAREREHLLRDLHDGVAGTLTNIALYSDLLSKSRTDEQRRQTQELIESLARQGQREIRAIMNRLDRDQLPWHEFFRELRDHADATLVPAGFEIDWRQPRPVLEQPTCLMAPAVNLLRAVKEAIQNAARHSQGDKVRIEFTFDPDRFTARVIDNGRGLAHLERTGRGLANMLRRARDLGGSAHFVDVPDEGLRVEFDIPLPLEFRAAAGGK